MNVYVVTIPGEGKAPVSQTVYIDARSCVEKNGTLSFYKDSSFEAFRVYGIGAWLSYEFLGPK